MFNLGINKKIKLKKNANSIQAVNTKNYGNNYWEFTKKKIIWARKNDKIKNEIDYDNKNIEKMKTIKKNKIDGESYSRKKHKITMFDKLNKFKKYDSLVIKR